MASSSKDKAESDLELADDAWDRFRQAVHVMAKAGPQHRAPTAKPKQKAGAKAGPPKKRHSAKTTGL